MWNKLFEEFDCDTVHRVQAIFTSIFVLQNRMQTAGEKIQTQISMKQWLLLSMTECCPKPRTLTKIGTLMGCSRQNVKKLALALEKQGFVRLIHGSNNSIQIQLTDKVNEYVHLMNERHSKVLELLFEDFTDEEIKQMYDFYKKLYAGMERVENFVKETD